MTAGGQELTSEQFIVRRREEDKKPVKKTEEDWLERNRKVVF